MEPVTSGYQPILPYELTNATLTFDPSATLAVKMRVYGGLYELGADNKNQFNEKKVWKNWP